MDRKVKLYALSTCGWCKKTAEWLSDKDISSDRIYVDKLHGAEREDVLDEMKEFNPRRSFPTVVIDDGKTVIIGFKPEELERELI